MSSTIRFSGLTQEEISKLLVNNRSLIGCDVEARVNCGGNLLIRGPLLEVEGGVHFSNEEAISFKVCCKFFVHKRWNYGEQEPSHWTRGDGDEPDDRWPYRELLIIKPSALVLEKQDDLWTIKHASQNSPLHASIMMGFCTSIKIYFRRRDFVIV